MEKQVGSYPSQTGQQIHYRIWSPDTKAKAVVQIIHGMAEHSARYEDFASFLCSHGYMVAADDHAGHGKTAEDSGKYGYFDEKYGWNKVVDDLLRFNRQLRDSYHLPVTVLGHSMGSFFARTLMIRNPEIANQWILSGTGNFTLAERYGGFFLANFSLFFKDPDAPAAFMHKLSFGAYNKKFKTENNEFAWLCTDRNIVQKYQSDPYCGGVFSGAFYRDLLYGVNVIHTKSELKKIPKGTQVYIFSGADDPVGNYGIGVRKVHNRFLKYGVNSYMKLYQGMRHEILNETYRKQVYHDVLSCLENNISH